MNVGVIFGGESCEHDISVITGIQMTDKMNEYLYNIVPIYIDKNGRWLTGDCLKDIDSFNSGLKGIKECGFFPNKNILYIKRGKKYKAHITIDAVILCLHGVNGEDGVVAGVLESSKVPYSSTSICGSSVALDKCVFKTFVKGLNINCVEGFTISENDFIYNQYDVIKEIEQFGYPIILKPSRQGSSIGIEVCDNANDLEKTIKKVFKYDKKILIEKFINVKKEVNIAIVKDRKDLIVSMTEEPITKNRILNFDDKYKKNPNGLEGIKRIIPAKITKKQYSEIYDMSTKIYMALDMSGVVRFDFIIDKDDKIYINEVNTIPGSMANYLFDKKEFPYEKLIDILIDNALYEKENGEKMIKSFDSGVVFSVVDMLKK